VCLGLRRLVADFHAAALALWPANSSTDRLLSRHSFPQRVSALNQPSLVSSASQTDCIVSASGPSGLSIQAAELGFVRDRWNDYVSDTNSIRACIHRLRSRRASLLSGRLDIQPAELDFNGTVLSLRLISTFNHPSLVSCLSPNVVVASRARTFEPAELGLQSTNYVSISPRRYPLPRLGGQPVELGLVGM
jgi:hypothetical protein